MARPKQNQVKENQGTLGVINNYAGQFFSLNMKKTNFFGVGERENGMKKLWLSPENWVDQAPDDLTEEDIDIIANSLRAGTIVVGKRWLPPLDKEPEIKKQYLSLLRESSSCTEEFKSKIRSLVAYGDHGNYTAKEILNAMVSKEKEGRNREPFITFLEDGLSHYHGPELLVEDFPEDPDNFTIEIDPSTMKVISSTRKKESTEKSMTAFRGLDNPAERSASIDKALG